MTTGARNEVTVLSSSSSSSNGNSKSSSSSSSNSGNEGSSSKLAVVCEVPMCRVFESPPSWVAPIMLDRAKYLIRYPPLGRRTVQYYCTNVDFYASNTHPQVRRWID